MVEKKKSLGVDAPKKKKSGVRVANRQAWVDTFVYLCPQHRGGTSVYDYCELSDGTRTNCTGRCTYNGSGACTQVTQFFKTYIEFLNGELSFEHGSVLPPPASKPKGSEQEKDKK